MVRHPLFAFLLICALAVWALQAAGPDRVAQQATASIRISDLRSEISFLASDEMRGRNTGTPFNEITARYLAHRFELMGLEPAPGGDSFFQYFSLIRPGLSEPNRFEIVQTGSSQAVVLGEDFFPAPLSANARVTASIVFAGYGLTAPDLDYDDYAGINVAQKIALMFMHEPGADNPQSPFKGILRSDLSLTRNKIQNAQRRGAAGVILVQDGDNHPELKEFSRLYRHVWPDDIDRIRHQLATWADQVRIPVIYASAKTAALLLNDTQVNLQELREKIEATYQPSSLPIPGVHATIETSLTREKSQSRNVLAYLPGSDPEWRKQVVVVGAHFDHVGFQEGKIFNGADDDASGVAGVLEIAEAFSLAPQKPKRSLLFVGWNGEEQGLLGSYFYVAHPLVRLDRTVAMFQMDMIGRNEEVPDPSEARFHGLEKQEAMDNANSVNILGYSRSQALRRLASEMNQPIGLDIRFRYDHHPLNLLRRSDHWPFLIQGVPCLFFHTGLHPDYHSPEDTADKINYKKMARIVRLVFLCTWAAADGPETARTVS